jgi:hypothetical protein
VKFQGQSAFRTSAKKAPKSENPRLQFTSKNREMRGKIYPKKISQRPKKAKIKEKITQKSEIPGKVCIQEHQPKKPQKAKIQGYNSPKKTGK